MVPTVSEAAVPPLTLILFGPMQVLVHGAPTTHLHSHKSLWLLALLALRHGRPAEREWLASTLWPAMDQSQAQANLRTVLSEMRQSLGSESRRLQSPNRQSLRLETTGANVDLLAFDTAVASKKPLALERAVALYRGPLLEGCAEEWIDQERNAREQDVLNALQMLADDAFQTGNHETAIYLYQRAISMDPWQEAARRGLMDALARRGDTNAALQVYHEFTERLKKDLKAVPDPETSALYTRLRAEARRRAAVSNAPSSETPTVTGYLPHALTDLIGREDERVEVTARLKHSRLVTLTGPGGIGKTRLALEVATEAVQDPSAYADGVWLVALDSITEDAQVAGQVASVLGLKEEPHRAPLMGLTEHLRGKRVLLVLDNCEHLLEASAQVAEHLLRECAGVRILATSRAAFGIPGETVWGVPGLAVPDLEHLPPGRTTLARVLSGYESVQLFVERAQSLQKTFDLNGDNALPIAQICARLEGIPLAIELAAARVKVLTVTQIASRLDNHLSLLTGGSRIASSRQQTLRGTLDWSYDLLTEAEQLLLGRLAVFAGGWTLEAMEQVCTGAKIEPRLVSELLTSLVDKSLVLVEKQEVGKRYRFLEMVRQYAAEQLERSGEAEQIRAKHLDYFQVFADAGHRQLMGPEQAQGLRVLTMERDNLRAALEWDGSDTLGVDANLNLALTLWSFWNLRGDYSEGRHALERAVERAGDKGKPIMRADVLNAAGAMAFSQSDYRGAEALFEEALRIRRNLEDRRDIAQSLNNLANVAHSRGDMARARAFYEESLSISQALDDKPGTAMTLDNLGALIQLYDPALARPLFEQSLSLSREMGDQRSICGLLVSLSRLACQQNEFLTAQAMAEESLTTSQAIGAKSAVAEALSMLGQISLALGDLAAAQSYYEENRDLSLATGERSLSTWALLGLGHVARACNDPASAEALFQQCRRLFAEMEGRRGEGWAIACLGDMARARGEAASAQGLYRESVAIFQAIRDIAGLAASLGGLAMVMLGQEKSQRAACLWGASEALYQSIGGSIQPSEQAKHDQQVSRVRLSLGEEAFTAAWAEGHAMTWEQASAYALEETFTTI